MQNRYTGDIGDFGKLGLLRQLSDRLSIGVNWYLVPDENHNRDGQHIGYLSKEDSFRTCDPPLFDTLNQVVKQRREVKALESSLILPSKTKYYSGILDFRGAAKLEREAIRAVWHKNALAELKGCDLVFVDPDNGIIVRSAENKPKSNKYVLRSELIDYYKQGSSVVYYQHQARKPDEDYIDQHRDLMKHKYLVGAGWAGLKFKSTSLRYYFFLLHPEHIAPVEACLDQMLNSPWSRHFRRLPAEKVTKASKS